MDNRLLQGSCMCGTSGETREYFRNRNKYIKKFKPINDEDCNAIEMAFAKKNADECKIWIRGIQEGMYINYNDD